MEIRKYHKYILIVAAAVFIITAFCSQGFHHFDEHFQIFEFAGLKLGINQPKDMAWEYQARIRPTIQPTAVVIMVKTMRAISITSPFVWAAIIRFLTGLFMLMAIYFCTSTLIRTIDPGKQKLFILLSYLLYFIPYIAVRFSSETMGSGFFLLGFSLLLSYIYSEKGQPWILAIVGIFMGLSFICRFQCGIMILGVFVWLAFIHRLPALKLLSIATGLITMIGMGALIDHWFYSEWVFTPWNYFQTDVMQGNARQFGNSPWFFYLSELFRGDAKSLIKILLLIGAAFFVLSSRRDIVAYTVIPFVLVHSLISHKEMRFMIPVAFFIPYITVVFWQYITQIVKSKRGQQILQLVLFQALFIDMLSLMANVIKPADGQPLVYEYLYQNAGQKPLDIYYMERGGNFFWGQGMLPMNFYNPNGHHIHPLNETDTTSLRQMAKSQPILMIANRSTDVSRWPIRPLYSSKPEWLQIFDINDWMKIKNDDWMVYQVIPAKPTITHASYLPHH